MSSSTVTFTRDVVRAVTLADSSEWTVVDPTTGGTWIASVEGELEADGGFVLSSNTPSAAPKVIPVRVLGT